MSVKESIRRLRRSLAVRFNNQYIIKDFYPVIAKTMPRPSLRFEVHLTEHCNLNCAGCMHFSPLAEPENADFAEMSRDFARLSELFGGHAEEIHLMGGEPLLHPDLILFLKMARENFPAANIDLVTNGITLSNQPEEFWLACQENRINLRPTKYPVKLDYGAAEALAQKYQVSFDYYGGGAEVKTLWKWGFDMEGRQNPALSFLKCGGANNCIQLSHGRLFTCAPAAYVHHFNSYFGKHLETCPEDSISIYEAKSREEIMLFLARPIPFCRYCLGRVKDNIPWRHSQKDISEWSV